MKEPQTDRGNIAILRDIEINQTRPNNAMLLSLFGESIKEEKPTRREKKPVKKELEKNIGKIEITVLKIHYERLMDKMEMLKRESQYVIDHVTLVKPSFGKPYLRLEITEGELENYKRTIKNL
ncbi:hypothetical protein [Flagellimonas pacifica]|uniref:Uncharacterized protein n=1 Tax=Flagellimonas pacifica TaxID=1247520 RepID=A0A285MX66_9FLAO|nr:hypothetical protein [Allomuricauda parva]SNZ01764.1 hypothetical protein SAMN06265377_3609 [Allomuricauda parva]